MIFTNDGLIQSFLNFLGVSLTTSDGYYLAFLTVSVLAVVILVLIMSFIFKFLVYLRKG